MPPRKNYKKKNYKKKYSTKITPFPFPKTKVAKLRYVEQFTLNPGIPSIIGNTNGMDLASYRANSCYDPKYAATGSQPRGWDEHTSLYREYCVLSSKMTFQPSAVSSTGASYQQPMYYGLIKRNEADPVVAASANIGEVMERRLGQYRPLPLLRTTNPKPLSTTFSHKKTFKTNPHTEMLVTDNSSSANADHQNGVLYDCYIMPNKDATQNEAAIPCIVTIEYIVLFTNPKALARS